MNSGTTICLTYLYSKLKEKNRGCIVSTKFLKELITRHIIIGDSMRGYGGSRKGIPKIYLPNVIWDMSNKFVVYPVIKRINRDKYEILPSKCEKKLKKGIFD